ncbi:MAG: GEVED domain-containing protein [Bacteroidota bacterium]
MKVLRTAIILLFLLVQFQSAFAQLPCGNENIGKEQEAISQQLIQQYSHFSKQNLAGSPPTYIAVKPHFVRTDAGVTNLNMAAFNNAVAIANQYFINSGIQFYICGTPANVPNYINKTAMYNWDTNGFNRDSISNANNVNNAHNIYFSNSLGGVGGFSFGMTQSKTNNRTFVLNGQANDGKTLIHELGHYFNLAHTFNNSDAVTIPSRELVTRNNTETAPRLSANCLTTGDFICDTPADSYNLSNGQLSGCNSTGLGITAVDANGDHFIPSPTNVMSYYFCTKQTITPLQYIRMNAALAVNNTPSSNPNNAYTLDCAETAQTAPSNLVLTSLSADVSLGIVITWTDNSTVETGYIIERSSTSATDGFIPIGGVDANVTSFTDTEVARNTKYYYRVKPSNSKTTYNSTIPNFTTPVICGPANSSACIANGNINIFKILNGNTTILNNTNSGCSLNSFGNFTSIIAPQMSAGKTYNFTMNTGYSGGYYPQHLAIWIDTNQDNDFDDAGEMVYQSSGNIMNGTTEISSTFTIPISAKVGSLRLRVRSRYRGDGIVNSPCETQSSGETEDYLINVLNSITISGTIPSFCPDNNTTTVNFTSNYVPSIDNVFNIELSDVNGSFPVTPVIVGTGNQSPISITIPSVPASSLYKLRVVGSNPSVISNLSDNFGYGSASAILTLVGKSTITVGDSTLLRITFSGAKPYSFTLSTGIAVTNITTNSYDFYVKPISATAYTIVSATGFCGNATVSGSVSVGVIPYCVPTYTSACSPTATSSKIAINRVQIQKNAGATLLDNNNSNCSSFNFSDFTNLPAPTLKGDSIYSVTATAYYGTSYYPQYYSVWIDYNHNNSFADAGELVWQSPTATLSSTGIFTIPQSAQNGATRMRIRSQSGSSPTDACINYYYGEAEDYSISIQQAISLGGNIAGSATICPNRNNNTTLTLSGQYGSVLKWQSANNSDFTVATDIANTTTSLAIINLSSTTYYRAVVQIGSSPIAYSSIAVLTAVSSPNVSPTLVNMNFGNSVTLPATGCAGTLSWYNSSGNVISMPVSPRCSEGFTAQCSQMVQGSICISDKSPIVTVKVIPSGSEITSITSGNWENTSTWNVGRVPQNGDLVIIRPNDTIFITTNTAQARCLEVGNQTGLQFSNMNAKLALGD